MPKVHLLKVDDQEFSTMLAALRYYQEHGQGDPDNRSDAIHAIAIDNEFETSMDAGEIDQLCERINTCGNEPAILEAIQAVNYYYGAFDYRVFIKHLKLHDDFTSEGKFQALSEIGSRMSVIFPNMLAKIAAVYLDMRSKM